MSSQINIKYNDEILDKTRYKMWPNFVALVEKLTFEKTKIWYKKTVFCVTSFKFNWAVLEKKLGYDSKFEEEKELAIDWQLQIKI